VTVKERISKRRSKGNLQKGRKFDGVVKK